MRTNSIDGPSVSGRTAWLAARARRRRALHRLLHQLATVVSQWLQSRPQLRSAPAPVADTWIDVDDPRVSCDPALDCSWWTVFNDPTLNGLIDTAYGQNLNLRIAGTRILEACAARSIAVGNLFRSRKPRLPLTPMARSVRTLACLYLLSVNLWVDGFNASWEADLWGRYRRNIEAANANFDASTERYGEALVLFYWPPLALRVIRRDANSWSLSTNSGQRGVRRLNC